MNAGAATASGDVLIFLHADSRLRLSAIGILTREMQRTGRRWGRFDVSISGRNGTLKVVAAMMNARSRLTGIVTGDQGIFVERALFGAIGGFPLQPLMEDIELSKRLKRAGGPPLCLAERIATSARRWKVVARGERSSRCGVGALPIGVTRSRPACLRIRAIALYGSDRAADLRQAPGSRPGEDAPRHGDRRRGGGSAPRPLRRTHARDRPSRRVSRGFSTRSSCGARPTPKRRSS
jgi:hypothetical protein